MEIPEFTRRRLYNHCITSKTCIDAHAVVKRMGAIQAQDYNQALWAIGVRTASATINTVEQAIAEAKIVRTWSQRGTIHFVPAEDTQWMLDLCASRIVAGHGRRMQQLELNTDIIKHCEALIVNALSEKKILTRSEIFTLFEDARIKTTGQRGYHILWHIAHIGVICMGPMQGKQQTFVLLDEWVSNLLHLTRNEALTELVWRYFSSHGPATDYDFARWSGLTLTDTRIGIAENNTRLVSCDLEGISYWMADTNDIDASKQSVYLLPAFDEYYLGYQDRTAIIAEEYAQKVVPGNNGVFQAIIVMNGQVVGIWKRKLKAKTVDITFYPFTPLDDKEDLLFAEAQIYADFMRLSLGKTIIENS